MTTDTTSQVAGAAETELFLGADWFDPLEAGMRTRISSPLCSRTRPRPRPASATTVCRFHGAGGGGPKGKRNGNYKHGLFTAEAMQMRQAISALVRASRQSLADLSSEYD